jgi:hypothetical protein
MAEVDYKFEIFNCIKEHPEGVTITEIAKKKGFSRNTVSKYVSMLAIEKQIFSKKIGVSNLYFYMEENYFQKLFTISYYKALLSGLKDHYPDSENIFKEIGKKCLESIEFSIGSIIPRELKGVRINRLLKLYYDVFGKFYPSYDVVQPKVNMVSIKDDSSKSKTIVKFINSEFLQTSDNYKYHFYIVAGMIEALWKKETGKDLNCKVEKIRVSDNPKESFVELSINF